MILLDTNLLGRMTDSTDPQCAAARRATDRPRHRLGRRCAWALVPSPGRIARGGGRVVGPEAPRAGMQGKRLLTLC